MPDDTIKLSPSQTLRVVSSTAESTWLASDKRPPKHYHPRQDERFEVLDGQLTVEVGKEEPRVLGPGDVLDVPRGTPHRMWNAGPDTAKASWRVTPALRTEEMFRFIGDGLSPARIPVLLVKFRNEYRPAR